MKYKNITKKDLYLNEIGLVKAGETIETKVKINNSNFELVIKKEETPKVENLPTNNKTN